MNYSSGLTIAKAWCAIFPAQKRRPWGKDLEHKDGAGHVSRLSDIDAIAASGALLGVPDFHIDSVRSRHEAEALFRLNARLGGSAPDWGVRFRELVCDYFLNLEGEPGEITDDQCFWLIGQIDRKAGPGPTEIDLLLDLMRQARMTPITLGRFTLKSITDAAVRAGTIDAAACERLRRALMSRSGDGSPWVTQYEAASLMGLDAALGDRRNDPAWPWLLSRAVANHILASAHPDPAGIAGHLSRERWLDPCARGLGDIMAGTAAAPASAPDCRDRAGACSLASSPPRTPAERALVTFLRREVPGLVDALAGRTAAGTCLNLPSADALR